MSDCLQASDTTTGVLLATLALIICIFWKAFQNFRELQRIRVQLKRVLFETEVLQEQVVSLKNRLGRANHGYDTLANKVRRHHDLCWDSHCVKHYADFANLSADNIRSGGKGRILYGRRGSQ